MSKTITLSELKANATKESIWLLIEGKVYNVTEFIDEHPGGDEVMLAEAGQDATEAFQNVGHSDEAREHFPTLFVGNFEQDSGKKVTSTSGSAYGDTNASPAVKLEGSSNLMYLVPLGLLGAYFGWRFYSTGSL